MKMWVSRKEFESLKGRVERLEEWRKNVASEVEPKGVYGEHGFYTWHQPVAVISLWSAIDKIMAHLGLAYKVVQGTPTSVVVEKTPPSKGRTKGGYFIWGNESGKSELRTK
jgi:hypothetical protein